MNIGATNKNKGNLYVALVYYHVPLEREASVMFYGKWFLIEFIGTGNSSDKSLYLYNNAPGLSLSIYPI